MEIKKQFPYTCLRLRNPQCKHEARWKGMVVNMIIINVDVMLAKRKMSVTELTERVGMTMANISLIKNGKVKAIKLETLDKICEALNCQPGDVLEHRPGKGKEV